MPTYIPPIALPELQRYLKDSSGDPSLLNLLQFGLETATERVYTYLGRDYTPLAAKTEIFWGGDRDYHRLRNRAGAITSWAYYDRDHVATIGDVIALHLFEDGNLIINADDLFRSYYEHHISYTQPASLAAPEQVKQVIIEIAAEIYEESKHGAGALGIATDWTRGDSASDRVRYVDLSDRHMALLAPYRRIPI